MGKDTGNKKDKWQVENRQKEVKNSIGNVKAKELMWSTHGHELRGEECWWEEGAGQRGIKRRKKWGNSNSTISKI